MRPKSISDEQREKLTIAWQRRAAANVAVRAASREFGEILVAVVEAGVSYRTIARALATTGRPRAGLVTALRQVTHAHRRRVTPANDNQRSHRCLSIETCPRSSVEEATMTEKNERVIRRHIVETEEWVEEQVPKGTGLGGNGGGCADGDCPDLGPVPNDLGEVDSPEPAKPSRARR